MKTFFLVVSILFLSFNFSINNSYAFANEFEDSMEEQLEKIDFSQIEEYLNDSNINFNLIEELKKMINGEYEFNFVDLLNVLFSGLVTAIKKSSPIIVSIFSIGALSLIFNVFKEKNLSSKVSEIVFFVFLIAISTILLGYLINIITQCKKTIINLTKIVEIMSPIIISLLVVSGGKISASLLSPTVTFLSSGILATILNILIPVSILVLVLEIISVFSSHVRLNRFSELFTSVLKWILSIIVFIFGVYITVQGIVSGVHDGISIKATKYLLSSSLPIVGGLVKDGFDVLVGGAILIKNSVGICAVIISFLTVVPIVIQLLSFSFLIKFSSGLLDFVADTRFSNLCSAFIKFINYLLAFLIIAIILITVTFIVFIISSNSLI